VPTAHTGPLRTGGGILYATVDTALDLKHAKRHTDDLRQALAAERGAPATVTGQAAIQHDLDPVFDSNLRDGEKIAVPAALLILVAVLGVSFAVAIPFAFAACTITGTLAIVYGLAHELSIVTYVTNLVGLIGLGLAIDYSLLVVLRFREEVERGSPTDDAIVHVRLRRSAASTSWRPAWQQEPRRRHRSSSTPARRVTRRGNRCGRRLTAWATLLLAIPRPTLSPAERSPPTSTGPRAMRR
jgi:RND superfamily putative drug exporter